VAPTPTFPVLNPRGQTTLFVMHFNLRSESTENRALTPSKPPANSTSQGFNSLADAGERLACNNTDLPGAQIVVYQPRLVDPLR